MSDSLEAVIESRELTKFYDKNRALYQVDLEVGRGQIFGFLGPNGAGKTTFVKTLLGFIKPTSGEILLLGKNPGGSSREKIGYLPERINIHPFLSGREFLKYQAELAGIDRKDINSEIDISLERVKLIEASENRIGTYSRGMLQRIGFAQALLGNPEVFILDEPNSGLDPIGILDMRRIILEEKKRGATVFLNSHRLSEVEKICDCVAILNGGSVVASGSHEELTGERGLEIELEENIEQITNYLKNLDPQLKIADNRFTLNHIDREIERHIPAKIVELGGRLVYYSKRQESMEDIFKRVVANSDSN